MVWEGGGCQMLTVVVLCLSAVAFSVSAMCAKLTMEAIVRGGGDSAAATGLVLLTRGVLVLLFASAALALSALRPLRRGARGDGGAACASSRVLRGTLPVTSVALGNREVAAALGATTESPFPAHSSVYPLVVVLPSLIDGAALVPRCGLSVHVLWPALRGGIAAGGLALFYSSLRVLALPQAMVLYSVSPLFAALGTKTAVWCAPAPLRARLARVLAADALSAPAVLAALAVYAGGAWCSYTVTIRRAGGAHTHTSSAEASVASAAALMGGVASGAALLCAKLMTAPVGDSPLYASAAASGNAQQEEVNELHIEESDGNGGGGVDVIVAHTVSVAWWQALGCCLVAFPFVWPCEAKPWHALFSTQSSADPSSSLSSSLAVLRLLGVGAGTFLGQAGVGFASSRTDAPAVLVSVLINCDVVVDFLLWQPLIFKNHADVAHRLLSVVSIVAASLILSVSSITSDSRAKQKSTCNATV